MTDLTEFKPGIYPDVPFRDYLKIDAVSNSYLGQLNDCPAKTLIERDDTKSLGLGRAVHTLVLEGEEAYSKRYAVAPHCNRSTTKGKKIWADFVLGLKKQEILRLEDGEKARAINSAVFNQPMASKLLADGVTERTVIWRALDSAIPAKCRPDALPDEGKRTLVDLKTTRDASERAFLRSLLNYGYVRGAAFYLDSMNYFKPLGSKFYDSFVFIAVETEAPYRTECYTLTDAFIEYGREEYKRLLKIHKECKKTGFYPHYSNVKSITTIDKPNWL